MSVKSVGHAVFAATLIALRVMALVQGGLALIWQALYRTVSPRAKRWA